MTDYHLPPALQQSSVASTSGCAGFADRNQLFEAIDRGDPATTSRGGTCA